MKEKKIRNNMINKDYDYPDAVEELKKLGGN